jgi:hypothetical protein
MGGDNEFVHFVCERVPFSTPDGTTDGETWPMKWGNLSAKEIVRQLKETGAVCLQSFFDPQWVENMRREAATLLTTTHNGVTDNFNPGGPSVRIDSKVFDSPHFSSFGQALNSNLFREIAIGYDQKSRFFVDAVITQDRIPCKLTDIHFDLKRSLKFMIYLSDVDKGCAAFRYCLGSHRENRKFRHRFLLMGGLVKELPNIPGPTERLVLTDMEGPRGTLIVFDTEGFHSAGTLQDGNERLLIRARSLLGGRFDYRLFREVAERSPLRLLLPLLVPEGRQATRGSARAT